MHGANGSDRFAFEGRLDSKRWASAECTVTVLTAGQGKVWGGLRIAPFSL